MTDSRNGACLNCGEPLYGHFCQNCGQKAKVGRLQVKEILTEFLLSPFHIENHGLPWTFWWLFVKPGEVIRAYVMGKRKLLYPAFRYLVLGGTIATIISKQYKIFHINLEDVQVPFLNFVDREFFVYANDNLTLFNLLAIPVFALGTYIFFRPKGHNYAENLTLQAYITAQQLWTLIIIFPFLQFFPGAKPIILQVYTVGTTLYSVYVIMKFFRMWNTLGLMLMALCLIYSYILQFTITYGFYLLIGKQVSLSH